MKKIVTMIFGVLLFSTTAFGQNGLPPPIGPCPPIVGNQAFCFTNSSQFSFANCDMEICLTSTPTQQMNTACGMQGLPQTICITIPAGQNGCINIPTPALPFSQWYDVSLTVRGVGPVGVITNPMLVLYNGDGSYNPSTSLTSRGGCSPGMYAVGSSLDGFNFNFRFDGITNVE